MSGEPVKRQAVGGRKRARGELSAESPAPDAPLVKRAARRRVGDGTYGDGAAGGAPDSRSNEVSAEISSDDGDGDVRAERGGRGRRKIEIAYLTDKSKRHITFSKRKNGLMKKAKELSLLTGSELMLVLCSETGHMHTFATRAFQQVRFTLRGLREGRPRGGLTCRRSPCRLSRPMWTHLCNWSHTIRPMLGLSSRRRRPS